MPHNESTDLPRSVNAFHLKDKENVHENEPRHPFIRHALGQVIRHEDIQQKLQKRVEHVEHDEEVEQRDGNVEDMFESDRGHTNKYAPERIRNEQTSYQLRVFKSELRGFERTEETPWMRWRCAGADHPPWLKGDAYLDLVNGSTE